MPDWQTPGRGTCSAFLLVRDGDATLDFARDVLGAEPLRTPLRKADGTLWNAELALGDSTLMVSQGGPNFEMPGFVYVYVPDAEAAHARARALGAEEVQPVALQFYGDRAGGVRDTNGTFWWFATHERVLDEKALAAAARAEEARRDG